MGFDRTMVLPASNKVLTSGGGCPAALWASPMPRAIRCAGWKGPQSTPSTLVWDRRAAVADYGQWRGWA